MATFKYQKLHRVSRKSHLADQLPVLSKTTLKIRSLSEGAGSIGRLLRARGHGVRNKGEKRMQIG